MDTVTTEELDAKALEIRTALDDYKEKDRIAKEAHAIAETIKFDFMQLLDKAGKSSYTAEGIGLLSKIDKLTITTPKTQDQKSVLFDWIRKNYGEEGYLQYVSVNHMSLNSLYKEALEESDSPATFRIPGTGEPTVRSMLRFSKR